MSSPTTVVSPADSGHSTMKPESGRDRILRVALEQFSARGFADVSMQDIATAAQMTKPALYYHFADKQELFARVFASEWGQFNDMMAAILDEQLGPAETLYRVAYSILQSGRGELRRMFTDFQTYLSPESRSRIINQIHPPSEILRPYLERLRDDGLIRDDVDLDLTLPLFFSMIFGQIRKLNAAMASGLPLPNSTNEQIAEAITNIMLRGISTSEEGTR